MNDRQKGLCFFIASTTTGAIYSTQCIDANLFVKLLNGAVCTSLAVGLSVKDAVHRRLRSANLACNSRLAPVRLGLDFA